MQASQQPFAGLWHVDWRGMLIPTTGLAELFIRGTLMYFAVLLLLRLFRRNQGSLNTPDLLVLVMVADAAQNGMAGQYNSLTEGAILVGTIFFWNYVLDVMGFRLPWVRRILHPEPVLLVRNGRVHGRNLAAELLTQDDLMEQLREQGIERLAEVKQCCLEADGHISVIRAKQNGGDGGRPKPRETHH
jgi:uncharacterized membrane protein YcaP (DUF421 family)